MFAANPQEVIMLHRVNVLTAILVAAMVISEAETTFAADKPNILVIWGDDIGQFNVSAYNMGVMGYRTPNIDRIAREGGLH
jgi:hypothetical protein